MDRREVRFLQDPCVLQTAFSWLNLQEISSSMANAQDIISLIQGNEALSMHGYTFHYTFSSSFLTNACMSLFSTVPTIILLFPSARFSLSPFCLRHFRSKLSSKHTACLMFQTQVIE